MKKVLFILLTALVLVSAQSVKLKKVELRNKRGTIKAPVTLTQLKDEEIIQRYGFLHLPLLMFSDQSTNVTYSISERIDSLSQSSKIKYASVQGEGMGFQKDLAVEKSFFKSTISGNYETIKFLQDTILTIGKKQWIVLEFEGTMKGKSRKGSDLTTDNYNYMQYLVEEHRKVTVSFNCPKREKQNWEAAIKKSVSTLKLK